MTLGDSNVQCIVFWFFEQYNSVSIKPFPIMYSVCVHVRYCEDLCTLVLGG